MRNLDLSLIQIVTAFARRRGRACSVVLAVLILLATPTARGQDLNTSLYFERIPLQDLLPILADHYGLDLIVTGDVPGIVTVALSDRPLPSVLDEILIGTGFVHRLSERSMWIIPGTTLLSSTFHLNYLSAEQVKEEVATLLQEADIAFEPSSNTLTVIGPAADLLYMERMLGAIDAPASQVEIRAQMIEVNLLDTKSLGIDWLYQWNDDLQNVNAASAVNDPTASDLHIAYSRLTDFEVDAVVRAILRNTDSKVVATPRIVAGNNQTSKILVGERLPYTSFTVETSTGAVQEQVDFADVGTQLEVIPLISEDSLIVLNVAAEISEVLDQEVQGIPRIGTREAHTRVVVANGETVVMGGLRKNQEVKTVTGVPFLSRIPVLGRLFRYEALRDTQVELLVFLTPTIVGAQGPLVDLSDHLVDDGDVLR